MRFTLVTFHFKLTFQTVDDDIQVKLTHTGKDVYKRHLLLSTTPVLSFLKFLASIKLIIYC